MRLKKHIKLQNTKYLFLTDGMLCPVVFLVNFVMFYFVIFLNLNIHFNSCKNATKTTAERQSLL